MKTDAWYNWHFWWWDFRSWLCHYEILRCADCKRNDRENG